MKKLDEMVIAINEQGIKRVGMEECWVSTTDEQIEINIVSMDKKFRLNHVIEVSNDEYVLHTKRKAKYKKKWEAFESTTFATPENVLNQIFNCIIAGHCLYNGMYTLDLFDETLEDALEYLMENVESNIECEDYEHLNASAELFENAITIDYTDSNGERMTDFVEFDNEVVINEQTGERYVICWLPRNEIFELMDLSICMWNK